MKNHIIKVKNLSKRFKLPDKSFLTVIEDLNLDVEEKSIITVTGASGSGKSTLLHLIGGLDKPDKGEIFFQGKDLLSFNDKQISEYRNSKIGFVYQFHYLMPELTVQENISFPFLMNNFRKSEAFAKAEDLLKRVGLKEKSGYMPYQLSGGERQRAAIARSLVNSPDILLADEPTGNLDWKTGQKVFALFRDMVEEFGLTAIVVTHNEKLADMSDSTFELQEGKFC